MPGPATSRPDTSTSGFNESWHRHLSRSKMLIAAAGISGDAKRLGGGELVLNT